MSSADPRKSKIFVVHGRNATARDGMFSFLRALGLQPIEWDQAIQLTGTGSPYIGEILNEALNDAQAIVVLMTPDEIAYLRSEYANGDNDPEAQPAAQARPNVLFEAGMAMGRNSERTVFVELGEVRLFTDVIGRHAVRIDNSVPKRKALALRLQTALLSLERFGCLRTSSADMRFGSTIRSLSARRWLCDCRPPAVQSISVAMPGCKREILLLQPPQGEDSPSVSACQLRRV